MPLTNRINTHPAPLLFLDTCAILDLIRFPYRNKQLPNLINATNKLLSKATPQPPQLWVVIADQVEKEWHDNKKEVSDELKEEIEKCQRELTIFSDILQQTLLTTNLTNFSLEDDFVNLSKRVLDVSLKIIEDDGLVNKAWQRVKAGEAPAKKGKQEMKDCVIIEHYLEVCQQLRTTGFSQPVIFVSSNVKDYGEPPNRIRSPLDTQFRTYGIQFVTDLDLAMSLI